MRIENVIGVPVGPLRGSGPGRSNVMSPRPEAETSRVHHTVEALQKAERSAEEIRRDIEAINEQLTVLNQSLQFSIDAETRDVVVKIVDKDSGEVVKQIPPEEVMNLRKRLREMSSLFVEKTV